MWVQVSYVDATNVDAENFWSGLKVWIRRPHILNRRVFGIEVVKTLKAVPSVEGKHDSWKDTLIPELAASGYEELESNISESFDIISVEDIFDEDEVLISTSNDLDIIVQLRNVIPKSQKFKSCMEALLVSKHEASVIFIPFDENKDFRLLPPVPYEIKYSNNRISLSIYVKEEKESEDINASAKWLESVVLKKISNWSKSTPKKSVLSSLSQVCAKRYSCFYNYLKEKYGKKLVEVWPEKTDPIKYVYEDIAIAAYLMTLWEKERKSLQTDKKQSFVDLGCGNGLLVHILASEGHPGIGVDVMKRAIWDAYGDETKLIEKVVIPSEVTFPQYDWIIGNHSDELTPWIPVIAAGSSYNMRAFVLPCCPYSFYGKYQRQNSVSSCYESYLAFIQELCQNMGFNVLQDKMRIPSTRRVCFICHSRNYDVEDEESLCELRSHYIKQHSYCQKKDLNKKADETEGDDQCENNEQCFSSFKPRDKVVPVRNCCSLDRTFIEDTVVKILSFLLREENKVEVELDGEKITWNAGGSLALCDLAKELGPEILLQLKNQCGGLQTLLRNHKNVFTVENAIVRLRNPLQDSEILATRSHKKKRKPQKKIKKDLALSSKPCVFHFHHPNGCPFSPCYFSHIESESIS